MRGRQTRPDKPESRPVPSWILWLSPVIVAPLLAVLWITWSARPKGLGQAREGVERYDKFRAALAEPDDTDPEHRQQAS
jgi:hypothetical protein